MRNKNVLLLPVEKYINLTDFGLIVTLKYFGFKVEAVDRTEKDNKRISFVFKKTNRLQKIISEYWEGKTLVNPLMFSLVAKEVKSVLKNN